MAYGALVLAGLLGAIGQTDRTGTHRARDYRLRFVPNDWRLNDREGDVSARQPGNFAGSLPG
jgi:hypothetical protein